MLLKESIFALFLILKLEYGMTGPAVPPPAQPPPLQNIEIGESNVAGINAIWAATLYGSHTVSPIVNRDGRYELIPGSGVYGSLDNADFLNQNISIDIKTFSITADAVAIGAIVDESSVNIDRNRWSGIATTFTPMVPAPTPPGPTPPGPTPPGPTPPGPPTPPAPLTISAGEILVWRTNVFQKISNIVSGGGINYMDNHCTLRLQSLGIAGLTSAMAVASGPGHGCNRNLTSIGTSIYTPHNSIGKTLIYNGTWETFFTSGPTDIIRTLNGVQVLDNWSNKAFISGCTEAGVKDAQNCNDWTSTSSLEFTSGSDRVPFGLNWLKFNSTTIQCDDSWDIGWFCMSYPGLVYSPSPSPPGPTPPGPTPPGPTPPGPTPPGPTPPGPTPPGPTPPGPTPPGPTPPGPTPPGPPSPPPPVNDFDNFAVFVTQNTYDGRMFVPGNEENTGPDIICRTEARASAISQFASVGDSNVRAILNLYGLRKFNEVLWNPLKASNPAWSCAANGGLQCNTWTQIASRFDYLWLNGGMNMTNFPYYTASGTKFLPDTGVTVWTGADPSGNDSKEQDINDKGDTCKSWTNNGFSVFGRIAIINNSKTNILDTSPGTLVNCASQHRLLCVIQFDGNAPVDGGMIPTN